MNQKQVAQENTKRLVYQLKRIFMDNADKRVVVIGTTCTGKSTLIKHFPHAQDMDRLIFPLLSKEESKYVCQSPWTEEIGDTMNRLVNERLKVRAGHPLFGTVLLDCDLIVYLRISDKLLKQRSRKKGHRFIDAKKMQTEIEEDMRKSHICTVTIEI